LQHLKSSIHFLQYKPSLNIYKSQKYPLSCVISESSEDMMEEEIDEVAIYDFILSFKLKHLHTN